MPPQSAIWRGIAEKQGEKRAISIHHVFACTFRQGSLPSPPHSSLLRYTTHPVQTPPPAPRYLGALNGFSPFSYSRGALNCVVPTHKYSFARPDPRLMCHWVGAELAGSQPAGFCRGYATAERPNRGSNLEEGGLCWVQLRVALHLWGGSKNPAVIVCDLSPRPGSSFPENVGLPQLPQRESCPQPLADKDTWEREPMSAREAMNLIKKKKEQNTISRLTSGF